MRAITVQQLLAERKVWRESFTNRRMSENEIVVDPGDDVICDLCNEDITTDLVWIERSYALCEVCSIKIKGTPE